MSQDIPAAYSRRFAGRTALVTGSTSGIGLETARLLASEGAAVVVTGLEEERGAQLVDEIQSSGDTAVFVPADLTVDKDLENLVRASLNAFERIDVLVNNAGRIIEKPFLDHTDEDWDTLIGLNGRPAFKLMKLVIPTMLQQGYGSIVNIASLAALQSGPLHAGYGFVKAGLLQMTKNVAVEFAGKGIRANAVLPGAILTPMVEDSPFLDKMTSMVPIGRIGQPLDVASAVAYLASEEASYITGTSLVVDGGVRS